VTHRAGDDHAGEGLFNLVSIKAGQIPLLARSARLPETIRGYGYIKEENIRKTMVEGARLEAELENTRFAAAAE
jgi:indolepyruvate ferredoxin oxidoreductase